jgi:hypothetical protein
LVADGKATVEIVVKIKDAEGKPFREKSSDLKYMT